MRKNLFKKSIAVLSAAVLMISMVGCNGGEDKSGKKEETSADTKNMVYMSSDMVVEGIEGDVSSDFTVKGDKLYFSTYEWIEKDSSEKPAEEVTGEENGSEETDTSEESSSEEETDTSEESSSEEEADTSEESSSEEEADTSEESSSEEEAGTGEESNSEEDTSEEEIIYDDGYTVYRFYVANLDGSDAKEIPLPEFDQNEYMNSTMVDDDGNIYIVLGNWNDKTETYTYKLLKIDEMGNELASEDITKALNMGQDEWLNKFIIDGKGRLIAVKERSVTILDENFQNIGEVKSNDNVWLSGAALTKDGEVICGVDGENAQAQVLDVDGKKWGETITLNLRYFSSSDALMSGNGEYDFYYKDDNGIYGYSIADKKETKILDYMASSISSDSSWGITPVAEDMMLGTYWEDTKTIFVKYTKVDPSQIVDKTTITFGGMWIDDNIKRAAMDFNKNNSQYQIEFKDYSNEEDPTTKMNADIIAGNIPDILCLSNLPVEQYAAKGILEDLNSYFEKDEELSTDDLLPTVYEAMQIDGSLYYISSDFSISTLIGKTSDVGTESGWTFDDLKALLEKKGDSARPFWSTSKGSMLWSFLYGGMNDFIDWQTGKCTFDDDDFKDMLEICNSYGLDEEEGYDEDGPSYPTLIKEGTVLFVDTTISLDEIQLYKAMYDADITFIGYPDRDKQGATFYMQTPMGIYSKSEVKDGAWEFLRTLMTKEYQGKIGNVWNTPTRQDCFDMLIKARTTTEKYTDELGQEVEPYSSGWGFDDLNVDITPSSQEEVDMYINLINSTKRVNAYNDSLMNIVSEEAEAYFKGEKSLDETVKIIQNRAETYVNENR